MTVTRRISKIIKDWIEYNIVWWWSEAVDTQLDPNSENPVQNKAIKAAIDTKLDAPAEEWSTWQFVRKGADGNEVYPSNHNIYIFMDVLIATSFLMDTQ